MLYQIILVPHLLHIHKLCDTEGRRSKNALHMLSRAAALCSLSKCIALAGKFPPCGIQEELMSVKHVVIFQWLWNMYLNKHAEIVGTMIYQILISNLFDFFS